MNGFNGKYHKGKLEGFTVIINAYIWNIDLNCRPYCWKQSYCTKKWRFTLKVSSVNATKSADSCGTGQIDWRNPKWKTSFFVQCLSQQFIILSCMHLS